MFYLINPGGRIVDFDNQRDYDRWRDTPGFREPGQAAINEFIKSRQELVEKQKQQAQPMNSDKSAIFFATTSDGKKDGYGVSGENIIKNLRKLGHDVKTFYDGQSIAILFHNPYSLTSIESQYRIIYTMFESDRIPDSWIDHLRSANLVLVPSKWCQEIFKRSGIESTVVPLGYDDTTFRYVDRKNKHDSHETFNFLHYDAFNIRKGFPEVFKAFCQEFQPSEPVKLVLKFRGERPPLPIMPSQYPNIEIILGQVENMRMQEIVQDADAFVFPSRGEGFGITPLEAMATGLPTIVPNAHGITEYFNPNYMYEVKVKEKCPALYFSYKNQNVGEMVVCDVDHLAAQMRWIYEHEREAKQKGKLASEYVRKWTFDKTALQLKQIVDDILSKPLPERPHSNILTLEKVS